ncbi:hypothetical protein E3N88_11035 [Mikania micrantha]|uniref:Protein-S-isoprenylcysteine O-methyltransferase n=1 Tax=Mikania micrantha TaxID=192012 RepID=A0A5N6PEB7_9ASTR|nr:hypothetical protein E3N88_11035 [Mikania micrantha]
MDAEMLHQEEVAQQGPPLDPETFALSQHAWLQFEQQSAHAVRCRRILRMSVQTPRCIDWGLLADAGEACLKPQPLVESLYLVAYCLLAVEMSFKHFLGDIKTEVALKHMESFSFSEIWWISNLGLLMVVVGEIIRKLAIITAGRAFTHLIQRYHEEHHKLITHGVYSIVRHPGYTGFLIWSVGTQIMLCNPISTLAFTVVVWNFFHRRIPYEEYFLRQFFGEYEEFAKRVPSGIPFVN